MFEYYLLMFVAAAVGTVLMGVGMLTKEQAKEMRTEFSEIASSDVPEEVKKMQYAEVTERYGLLGEKKGNYNEAGGQQINASVEVGGNGLNVGSQVVGGYREKDKSGVSSDDLNTSPIHNENTSLNSVSRGNITYNAGKDGSGTTPSHIGHHSGVHIEGGYSEKETEKIQTEIIKEFESRYGDQIKDLMGDNKKLYAIIDSMSVGIAKKFGASDNELESLKNNMGKMCTYIKDEIEAKYATTLDLDNVKNSLNGDISRIDQNAKTREDIIVREADMKYATSADVATFYTDLSQKLNISETDLKNAIKTVDQNAKTRDTHLETELGKRTDAIKYLMDSTTDLATALDVKEDDLYKALERVNQNAITREGAMGKESDRKFAKEFDVQNLYKELAETLGTTEAELTSAIKTVDQNAKTRDTFNKSEVDRAHSNTVKISDIQNASETLGSELNASQDEKIKVDSTIRGLEVSSGTNTQEPHKKSKELGTEISTKNKKKSTLDTIIDSLKI
ncbi:hypothetical protein GQ473_06020 [archaeon]|nr:hypothetical protein [archaeon]